MAVVSVHGGGIADHVHPEPQGFIRKYIFSIDHKIIGIQDLITGFVFLVLAGMLAEVIRTQLLHASGGFVSPDTYNEVYSVHGSALLWLVGAGVVVLVVALAASPTIRNKASLSHVTSGRSTLVSTGMKVSVHHPVIGVGVGGFKRAYADLAHLKGKEPKAAASHTTPITVAAETGFPGLLLFLWLVATALAVAFRRIQRDFDGAARLAFGLALVAILVHCIFYNALFEDPSFWALLALIAVGARTWSPAGD